MPPPPAALRAGSFLHPVLATTSFIPARDQFTHAAASRYSTLPRRIPAAPPRAPTFTASLPLLFCTLLHTVFNRLVLPTCRRRADCYACDALHTYPFARLMLYRTCTTLLVTQDCALDGCWLVVDWFACVTVHTPRAWLDRAQPPHHRLLGSPVLQVTRTHTTAVAPFAAGFCRRPYPLRLLPAAFARLRNNTACLTRWLGRYAANTAPLRIAQHRTTTTVCPPTSIHARAYGLRVYALRSLHCLQHTCTTAAYYAAAPTFAHRARCNLRVLPLPFAGWTVSANTTPPAFPHTTALPPTTHYHRARLFVRFTHFYYTRLPHAPHRTRFVWFGP